MQHCEARYRHAQFLFRPMHLPKTFAFLARDAWWRQIIDELGGVSPFALQIMRLHSRIGPSLTMESRGFLFSFVHSFFFNNILKANQNPAAAARIRHPKLCLKRLERSLPQLQAIFSFGLCQKKHKKNKKANNRCLLLIQIRADGPPPRSSSLLSKLWANLVNEKWFNVKLQC